MSKKELFLLSDFTMKKYASLCDALLSNGYTILSVEEYLSSVPQGKYVILRHDVDKMPENALEMAKIEYEKGIRSTYYFRFTKNVFIPDLIREISELGHEIGFHYETLHKAKGDFPKAIKMFRDELAALRKIVEIKTICMHGNSLSKWDNRDIWKSYDFKEFDILGEAYLSIDFDRVVYFSDSGGCWNNERIRIKDVTTSSSKNSPHIESTDDIIELVQYSELNELYLLAHPDRWNDSLYIWIYEYISKKIRNTGKILYRYLKNSR